MAKKYVKNRVSHAKEYINLNDLDGKSFEEVTQFFHSLCAKYEKNCISEDMVGIFHFDSWGDSCDCFVDIQRWETDEEFNKRVEKLEKARLKMAAKRKEQKAKKQEFEQKQQLIQEENERKLFQRLKEKYGNQ